jgi:hypothetical protein
MKRITKRSELIKLAHELNVRADWHEPDEQDLTAIVAGTHFDNTGIWPISTMHAADVDHRVELHVFLYRTEIVNGDRLPVGEPIAAVNLATLFAWATGYESNENVKVMTQILKGK